MVVIGLVVALIAGLSLAFQDGSRYLGIVVLVLCAVACLVVMVGHIGV